MQHRARMRCAPRGAPHERAASPCPASRRQAPAGAFRPHRVCALRRTPCRAACERKEAQLRRERHSHGRQCMRRWCAPRAIPRTPAAILVSECAPCITATLLTLMPMRVVVRAADGLPAGRQQPPHPQRAPEHPGRAARHQPHHQRPQRQHQGAGARSLRSDDQMTSRGAWMQQRDSSVTMSSRLSHLGVWCHGVAEGVGRGVCPLLTHESAVCGQV